MDKVETPKVASMELDTPELKGGQEINKTLFRLFKSLDKVLRAKNNSSIFFHDNLMHLGTDAKSLVTITPDEILLAGRENVQDKIISDLEINELKEKEFNAFLEEIGGFLVRLNHVGISYFTPDTEAEKGKIVAMAKALKLDAQEEKSGDPKQKWIFLGDTTKIDNPLFEMVLNESSDNKPDLWRPHFQIDFDVNLSADELRKISKKHFGQHFPSWELDLPNDGTVLMMGNIGNIHGKKIALGLGTSSRNVASHRQHVMRRID